VAVEELVKWDGIDAVISLGIVDRQEFVTLLIESTRKVDPDISRKFLERVDILVQDYEKEYIAASTGTSRFLSFQYTLPDGSPITSSVRIYDMEYTMERSV